MKDTRTSNPRHLAFAGITAYSLYKWYDKLPLLQSLRNRLVRHDKCYTARNVTTRKYPENHARVIIAVTNGNKILLSKYANREYTCYALLAGFTEIGEH